MRTVCPRQRFRSRPPQWQPTTRAWRPGSSRELHHTNRIAHTSTNGYIVSQMTSHTVILRFPSVALLILFFATVVRAMSTANAIVAMIAARTENTSAMADARRAGRQISQNAKSKARNARPHAGRYQMGVGEDGEMAHRLGEGRERR